MSETVITNAKIITADQVIEGTIAFDETGIRDVSSGPTGLAGAIDANGDFISPGLVELHTDNLERHVTPRPSTHWPTAPATLSHDREIAAAGITTVFNALSLGELHKTNRRIETLYEMCAAIGHLKAEGNLKSDHYLHLRCELSFPTLLEMLEPLAAEIPVKLISVMDHTPGQRQFVSLEQYAIYYQGKYNMSDAELEEFIEARRIDQRLHGEQNRRKVVALAHERGIHLASHDDAQPEHVEEAVRDKVSIAEFPTTHEAAKLSHANGLAVLMGGPNLVRGKSHNGNLSARDAAKAGYLDIISSDYVPSSLLFAALLAEETVPGIELPQAINMVSRTPARHVGMDDRGEIAAGLRADLVRFKRTSNGPIIRQVWCEGQRVA